MACSVAFAVKLAALAPSFSVPRGQPVIEEAPVEYRRAHQRTQLAGMGVLTGWAAVNIGGGIAGALVVRGEGRFVHEMNALWNSVNLTLGIVGLVQNTRRHPAMPTAASAGKAYRKARTVFAVNNAIDILYIGGGVLVAELGRRFRSPRAEGYGKAVVFQGAFLFAFDLAMLLAHWRAASRWRIIPALARGGAGLSAAGAF